MVLQKRDKNVSGISFHIRLHIEDAMESVAAPADSIHKFIKIFYQLSWHFGSLGLPHNILDRFLTKL